MSDQGKLWPINAYPNGPPKQSHSRTSKAAAEKIRPGLGKLQKAVHDCLKDDFPLGLTDEEMQIRLDIGPNTQRPRRRELQLKGIIVDSGNTRSTRSGRQAVVWIYEPRFTVA
jgi:hypothetical protein